MPNEGGWARPPLIDLCRAALEAVAPAGGPGLEYADARCGLDERQALSVRDGALEALTVDGTAGIGVRVLWRGAWGFAARTGLTPDAARSAAVAAVEVARASAAVNGRRVTLCPEAPQRGRYDTPVREDAFAVPLARKLAELAAACEALRGPPASATDVRTTEAHLACRRLRTAFASTEGSELEQTLAHTGCGMKVVCTGGGLVQPRSYPADLDGGVAAKGYELLDELDLAGNAERLREEARMLLRAPPCPTGRRALLLDPSQLALQIHESCGHPTESDRAFGEELSLAGGSFLAPARLGIFQYGSSKVNLTADATTPGALGTFGWDDEGVPARRTPLVAEGRFVGYLTSRETAARLGLAGSGGCMRAESWNRPPLVRMVNVSLEPDPRGPSLEELIADTDDGVLLAQNRSWSIDDLRLSFQFGCEIAWEIKHGKRVRVLRAPLYTGSTPTFWGSCDAVGRPEEVQVWGFVSCGKGDPVQTMSVGHACPPARFRDVELGSG